MSTDIHREAIKSAGRAYNVLMIAPTSFFADYGCHVRILEEARILRKLGHEITIATYHNGNDIDGLNIQRTLPIPWRKEYEVGSSRHKIGFDLLLGLKTLSLLFKSLMQLPLLIQSILPQALLPQPLYRRRPYDVIHAHLHEGALIGLVLGKLFGIPVVFDFQGSLTSEMLDHGFMHPESFFHKAWLALERWIDHSVPAILTSSAHAERLLIQEFDCRPEQVQVLPDCVNADTFKPRSEFDQANLAALRESLGIPAHKKVIVYLGLLAEYQGTSHLLQAVQKIKQAHPDVHLLLMGFPLASYPQEAAQLGIADAVTFTGRIPYPDAPRYLALGDVGVAPKLSLTEGCGKLLDYMAMALPTVAFDTPVAREYLGMDGLLAEFGDVDSLAEKLTMALYPEAYGEMTWAQRLGQRLRQRAIQQFEWHRAGLQIEETYRALVEKTPPSGALVGSYHNAD
ncbi:MAG: glycosyltransferase family 4 protein [Chloroflexota bacterium]